MSSATSIGHAPYPGLRPFQLEDAELFFGRETQVNEMLTRIENQPDFRFLAVIGASERPGSVTWLSSWSLMKLRIGPCAMPGWMPW